MPELAEVEWYRKQWDVGLGSRITAVELHPQKRVFRGTDPDALRKALTGSTLLNSEARGKRMAFRFTTKAWLGIHLGMTGTLRVEPSSFKPGKHAHLVLRQATRSLVFSDSRQFGRVRFYKGVKAPEWWDDEIPEILSPRFSLVFIEQFLKRHARAPIKGVLLMQDGFSGIGNWMADEILWRAHIFPVRRAGKLDGAEQKRLWRETRIVARQSLKILGMDDSHLPGNWLIHQRWSANGVCPKHQTLLRRATIGGRTTAWCPKCQRR